MSQDQRKMTPFSAGERLHIVWDISSALSHKSLSHKQRALPQQFFQRNEVVGKTSVSCFNSYTTTVSCCCVCNVLQFKTIFFPLKPQLPVLLNLFHASGLQCACLAVCEHSNTLQLQL
jgi:hypothetical protein